ncbi:MAG: NAD(P)/FAD-dependent oxidoreductase [Hyphomicrobiaceae bacterium]
MSSVLPPADHFGVIRQKSHNNPDLVIVGGGIVGLWCAERAGRLGLKTVLLEQERIGNGASGGFLGALMPHQPVNWIDKKGFQLDALLTIESEILALEEATGILCGYRRCGRLMPIYTQNKFEQSKTWQTASRQHWPSTSPTGDSIGWDILNKSPNPEWLSPATNMLACDYDSLSARLNPRTTLQALATKASTNVEIRENTRVTKISTDATVHLSNASTISPGHVIITAGYEGFALLQPIAGRSLGTGVKGQAALLRPKSPVSLEQPIIYARGTYIIAHDSGLIAIGSTSENTFQHPNTVDAALEDLIQHATTLCPQLEGAEVIERWAGVRPKAIGREPIVGALPEARNVIVASGGFKITYAIAHRLADAALSCIAGPCIKLPEKFKIAHHYASATERKTKHPDSVTPSTS